MFRAILIAAFTLALASLAPALAGNWPPSAPDLSITLLPAATACEEAEDCRLGIRIENLGSAAFTGSLRLAASSNAPAVPGPGETAPWACARQGFARLTCEAETVTIAPGMVLDLDLNIRLLPTPREQADICVSLDWTGPALGARDRLFGETLATLGAETSKANATQDLMAALFGGWGEGDLRSANDSHCASLAIGEAPPASNCGPGERRVEGTCRVIATLCTAGRSFQAATARCACPADKPDFNVAARICMQAAALTCEAGRSAHDGLCVCPRETPMWNAGSARYEALALPAGPAIATTEKPAKPAARKQASKPAVVGKQRQAKKACAAGRQLRGGRCVRTAAAGRNPNRAHAAKPVAARGCPPMFVYNSRRDYCWPALWLDPDVVLNGPPPRRK